MSDSGTVLVVDDEQDLADMYALQLSEEFDVETAYDGKEALALLDESIDVVLLDRRMPELSGDDVVDEIEQRDVDPVVAMVTAVDPDFDIAQMSIDDYIVKPVSKDKLLDTVNELVSIDQMARLRRELSAKRVRRNVLEVEKSQAALRDNEEYQQLTRRIEELEAKLDGEELSEEV